MSRPRARTSARPPRQTTSRERFDHGMRDALPLDMTLQLLRAPNVLSRSRNFRIIVGVDLSEYSDIVIEHALDQAARHDEPELHFLTVREKRSHSNEELTSALSELAENTTSSSGRTSRLVVKS